MRLKDFYICECPEPTLAEDVIVSKPSSPVDMLGFRNKCCWCIPLKMAAVIICIITMIWAAVELHAVDRYMTAMFPERGDDFYYTKLFYILMCVLLILACGLLLLGIVVEKNKVVNIFVWYAFAFNCAFITLTVAGTLVNVMRTGSMKKKQIFPLVLCVLWSCLFYYFLMIVNSYKLMLWL